MGKSKKYVITRFGNSNSCFFSCFFLICLTRLSCLSAFKRRDIIFQMQLDCWIIGWKAWINVFSTLIQLSFDSPIVVKNSQISKTHYIPTIEVDTHMYENLHNPIILKLQDAVNSRFNENALASYVEIYLKIIIF